MGCLNADQGFSHWFGNIHLSGPCNRSCYFCIGQHMMALDPFNNLDVWPLTNIDEFIERCHEHDVREVNLTGTNTDPLLCRHLPELHSYLRGQIPRLIFGVRTNGVGDLKQLGFFDKGSLTICSFDTDVYRHMMGGNRVPDVREVMRYLPNLKLNVVLGPENTADDAWDVFQTLDMAARLGIARVNLREPYGQPHVGNPFERAGIEPEGRHLGMPWYRWLGVEVTYWDVHYVEVESVNLYASGVVSVLYPITKGHDLVTGEVKPQREFPGGRITKQWVRS